MTYITTFCLQIVVVLAHIIMIGCTKKVKYNKIINPILLFCPLIITQWVIMRVGPVDGYFYPNMLQDGSVIRGYFTNFNYVNVLGIIPEILILL